MTAAAALSDQDPLAAQADEAGEMLRELARIGMGMARGLGRFADALSDSLPVGMTPTREQASTADSLMRAFARVSRAVRQSLALQARLIADVAKFHAGLAAETARRTEAEAAVRAARRVQGRLRRGMAAEMAQSAIESLEREPLETERLFDDLDEAFVQMRGQAPAGAAPDDADFADIAVDVMALDLCDALGIDPGADWWVAKWGMEDPARIRPKRPVPAQPPPWRAAARGGPVPEKGDRARPGMD
jgi:hypothetical protein